MKVQWQVRGAAVLWISDRGVRDHHIFYMLQLQNGIGSKEPRRQPMGRYAGLKVLYFRPKCHVKF